MDNLLHYTSCLVYNLKLGLMKNYEGKFDLSKDVLVLSPLLTKFEQDTVLPLLDSGARFIYDHLWERPYDHFNQITNFLNSYSENGLAFFGYEGTTNWSGKKHFVPMFFWIHEYLRTNSVKVKLHQVVKTYKFLMAINRRDAARVLLVDMLGDRLKESLYSLVYKNKFLPDASTEHRAYNSNWYDSTYFSLVAETHQLSTTDIFLTEKTFKPIMYGHPFLLYAQPYSLDLLKRNGFKTYPQLFDESYDNDTDLISRIDSILYNIDNFNIKDWESVQDTVQYNLDLFYDETLVMSQLNKDLIDPIVAFINEK